MPGIATQLLGANASSVLFDPKTRALYVGTESLGVFRSTGSGRSFRRINSGLPLDTFPGQNLVADPAVPGLLYAGSLGSSVQRLENR